MIYLGDAADDEDEEGADAITPQITNLNNGSGSIPASDRLEEGGLVFLEDEEDAVKTNLYKHLSNLIFCVQQNNIAEVERILSRSLSYICISLPLLSTFSTLVHPSPGHELWRLETFHRPRFEGNHFDL